MRIEKSSQLSFNENLPFLKTIEQMSKRCGIGENRLRYLVDIGEMRHIQIGNRRLLTDAFVIDWINRTSTPVSASVED